LTLISCNVYRIGIVAHSLVKAAQRGVQLTVIMETPHKMGCKRDYNTLTALGKDVQDVCSVYYWPLAKRALGGNKAPGILHVKCLVADGRWLFLSSANFTRQAFTVNMELGLLVRGGSLPESVEGRFRRLVKDGVLELVDE
jgi:phosphatidylserine/phosphatidylglycerophosphate/cardiolipin synthase-like enzyme